MLICLSIDSNSSSNELNLAKNIFVCDSSVLNEIDITPITLFSMNNILGMILIQLQIFQKLSAY